MNRDHALKIIADHREMLAADFGIKSLALSGSVLRGEATAASDVDLLVEFDGLPGIVPPYRHPMNGYLLAPELPLSGLVPGSYEVEVEVSLPGGKRLHRAGQFRVN